MTTPPRSPPDTKKLSANVRFIFGKNPLEPLTPVQTNATNTYNQNTRHYRDENISGTGQGPMKNNIKYTGRGRGHTTKSKNSHTTAIPDLMALSPSSIFKPQLINKSSHPYADMNIKEINTLGNQKIYSSTNTIPYKTNTDEQYSFCFHISVRQRKSTDEMSKEAIVEHILQSMITGNNTTKLLSTPSPSFQTTTTKS
jgi:hypothetical protein